jgi:hypothetical protein
MQSELMFFSYFLVHVSCMLHVKYEGVWVNIHCVVYFFASGYTAGRALHKLCGLSLTANSVVQVLPS